MSVHLLHALEHLKTALLDLSALTEEQVWKSLQALEQKDVRLAEKVIANDVQIDQMEIDLEEECLKILALYQPVAYDLRFVICVLKINNDLERIGDLAKNIAQRAESLADCSIEAISLDHTTMAEKVMVMLRDAITAFTNDDIPLARKVCSSDLEVNTMHRKNYALVADAIVANPEQAANIIEILSVSRYLERIADLATNIAEDAIYLVDGEIVRHSQKKVITLGKRRGSLE